MECNEELLQLRIKQGTLVPGKLAEAQFYLLIEMSSIRSEKVILALMEYLVKGRNRIDVCDENGVGSSHFSVSLDRLQHLSRSVAQLSVYYRY